jgi:hypothetical protein
MLAHGVSCGKATAFPAQIPVGAAQAASAGNKMYRPYGAWAAPALVSPSWR